MSILDRFLVGLVLLAGVAVIGVGAWVITVMFSDSDTDLERAADSCSTENANLDTGDDGKSMHLTISMKSSAERLQAATCVLEQIDAPDAMVDKLIETRAIDGRQEDTWDDFSASWTYYPDDGLRIIIEQS